MKAPPRLAAAAEVAFRRPSFLTIVVALLLAAIGLAMAISLASTHALNHANREGLPERAMTLNPDHGIDRNTSQYAVDNTVTTLERILQAKGGKPSGAWHWQRTSTWSSTAGTATLTPWPRRSGWIGPGGQHRGDAGAGGRARAPRGAGRERRQGCARGPPTASGQVRAVGGR